MTPSPDPKQAPKAFVVAMFCAALAGCGPDPTMQMQTEGAGTLSNADWEVTRAAVFKDDLAYNDRRGVYVITDKRTGRQYIGVSGVGVAEVGRHGCGKNCVAEDER